LIKEKLDEHSVKQDHLGNGTGALGFLQHLIATPSVSNYLLLLDSVPQV
jgi:hypothetical protein